MPLIRRMAAATAGIAALGVVYRGALRERVVHWGATADEAAAELPGYALIQSPEEVTTRAISIDAPRSAVWPWLVQMGPSPRAGAYTYDWIENLFGLQMHSSEEILPAFQHPEVGDTIGLGPNEMRLAIVRPPESLCWLSADGNWLWSFTLREDGERTRLISRNSFHLPNLGMRLGTVPMEIGSLVMERKMLLGVKERAERST